MLFQQNIVILGAVDFYSRISEDQDCTTKRVNVETATDTIYRLADIGTRT